MARTVIDLDPDALAEVKRIYDVTTNAEAVRRALDEVRRRAATETFAARLRAGSELDDDELLAADQLDAHRQAMWH